MTGLPKFVRDQMAGTPAPTSHPDANVLTAFAENMLTVKERQRVIEHLSICADCREIAFLAQPGAVATQTVLATKPRRLTWMAWAAVAAVVVVVASAVVVLQREQVTKTQPPVAIGTTPPRMPEAKPAGSATSAADIAASDTKTRAERPRQEAKLDAGNAKSPAEPILTAKDISANEERSYMKAPVILPPSAADQKVTVAGAAAQQAPTGPEQRNIAGQIQQAQGPLSTANNVNIAAASENLVKAESAPSAKVAKKQRVDAFHGLATGYTAAPAAAPVLSVRAHWQISPTGTLERSYTTGNWAPVLAETGVKFQVVSVIGNTVWAGGEHGALYVSRDGGTTWNASAIGATTTITSVHFSDDLHGRVKTADGQIWESSDAGKSWQKQ
jgi:hypothetical protein